MHLHCILCRLDNIEKNQIKYNVGFSFIFIHNNEHVKRNIYVYLFNLIDGMKMRGVKGAANGNAKSRNSVVSCPVVRNVCFCFTLPGI